MKKDMRFLFVSWWLISVSVLILAGCKVSDDRAENTYELIKDDSLKALNDSIIFGTIIHPNECVNCYLVFQVLRDNIEEMQQQYGFTTVFLLPEIREIEREPFVNKELGMKDFEGGKFIYSDTLFERINEKVDQGSFQINYRNASGLFLLDRNNQLIYFQDFKRFDLGEVKARLEEL